MIALPRLAWTNQELYYPFGQPEVQNVTLSTVIFNAMVACCTTVTPNRIRSPFPLFLHTLLGRRVDE